RNALEAEGGRDHDGTVHPVPVEFRIVFAGSQGVVDRLGAGWDRGRERYDRAHVEFPVRQAVEPAAYAGRDGVVDGGVTQGTRDAEAFDMAVGRDIGLDPD